MEWIRLSRAIGGLLSVVSLLVVLLLHVIHPTVQVSAWVVGVLLSLIGGLLAVDVFRQEFPTLEVGLEWDDD